MSSVHELNNKYHSHSYSQPQSRRMEEKHPSKRNKQEHTVFLRKKFCPTNFRTDSIIISHSVCGCAAARQRLCLCMMCIMSCSFVPLPRRATQCGRACTVVGNETTNDSFSPTVVTARTMAQPESGTNNMKM